MREETKKLNERLAAVESSIRAIEREERAKDFRERGIPAELWDEKHDPNGIERVLFCGMIAGHGIIVVKHTMNRYMAYRADYGEAEAIAMGETIAGMLLMCPKWAADGLERTSGHFGGR
jgi:hypothetical protein